MSATKCADCDHLETEHTPADYTTDGDPLRYVAKKRPCSICDCDDIFIEYARDFRCADCAEEKTS